MGWAGRGPDWGAEPGWDLGDPVLTVWPGSKRSSLTFWQGKAKQPPRQGSVSF